LSGYSSVWGAASGSWPSPPGDCGASDKRNIIKKQRSSLKGPGVRARGESGGLAAPILTLKGPGVRARGASGGFAAPILKVK
jgi:hypothetical protein